MSQTPDVTVVIPVYNVEEYLHETIGSVLAQDIGLDRLEIVAVDDGSSDRSLEILREFEADYPQVRAFTMPNSGSAAAPSNRGLDEATGRFVFFMGSDDTLEPDTLRKAVDIAERTGNKIVLVKMGITGKAGRTVPQLVFRTSHTDEDFIESEAYRTLAAIKLFDRKLLVDNGIRYPLGHRIGEDQPFTLRAYLLAPQISALSDKVYYWVRNRDDGSNLTATGQPPQQEMLKIKNYLAALAQGEVTDDRRAILLRRPLIGNAGLRTIFGRRFMTHLDAEERARALDEFSALISPLTSDAVRVDGSVETQIILDLVVAGDLAGLEELSLALAQNPAPALFRASDGSGLVYRTGSGREIGDLRLVMAFEMSAFTATESELIAQCEVGARGSELAPDRVRFLWKHRRSGAELDAHVDVGDAYPTAAGVRQLATATMPTAPMDTPGDWDAFIELGWGEAQYRRRFGSSRVPGIDVTSRTIGSPASAVVYYTVHGNVTFDRGPAGEHPKAQPLPGAPEVTIATLGRHRVIILDSLPEAARRCAVTGRGKRKELSVSPAGAGRMLALSPKWAAEVSILDEAGRTLWSAPLGGD